jgi:hypothetical protein
MDDVFTIPSEFSANASGDERPSTSTWKVDLFISNQDVTLEVVKKASVLSLLSMAVEFVHCQNASPAS